MGTDVGLADRQTGAGLEELFERLEVDQLVNEGRETDASRERSAKEIGAYFEILLVVQLGENRAAHLAGLQ